MLRERIISQAKTGTAPVQPYILMEASRTLEEAFCVTEKSSFLVMLKHFSTSFSKWIRYLVGFLATKECWVGC